MAKRGTINPDYGMTNAAFFNKIRSALRKQWGYSKSYRDALSRAKVPYMKPGRRKFSIECELCLNQYGIGERIVTGKTKQGKEKTSLAYAVHHKEGAGQLKSFEDLSEFARRLFCASERLEVLCWHCHKLRHEEE